jgi:Redoxin
MSVLSAAVIIVGALCLLDLLLTLGVIRRLRDQAAMFDRIRSGEQPLLGLAAGKTPAPFKATSAEGAAVRGPAGLSLVAFFAASCPACPKRVPAFAEYLRTHRIGRDEALAVVTGQTAESVAYLGDLAAVANVCIQPHDGSVGQAFGVQRFPAFFLLDADGTIVASGYDPAALPVLAAA